MVCVKPISYLSPMRAAKVQASLRICAVSPEPPLLAHTSIESRGTFRRKARSLAPLNGWAYVVKICHDGMLEDTNSFDPSLLIVFILAITILNLRSTYTLFRFTIIRNLFENTWKTNKFTCNAITLYKTGKWLVTSHLDAISLWRCKIWSE